MAEFDPNIRPGEKVPGFTNEQVDPEDYGIEDGEKLEKENKDDDWDGGTGDGKPFAPLEVRILNTLHKYLTRSDFQSLSQETPENYGNLNQKFWDVMKLFGMSPGTTENNTRASKYAKWALDNWTEKGDYGNIENPIKVPLKWYDVDREESGSQIEYKSGNAEILGFDEDNAVERADYNFYDWGGEMETDDYGDYESYDSEITRSDFMRVDEGLARVLCEGRDEQKIQDLLFQFWMRKNIGPTLDPDKLKLIGFDMNSEEDKILVYNNLIEYYGDEELANIVHERLEGVHDADYQFIVTSYDSLTPRTYKSEARGLETYVDVLINGDQIIPISQEDGTVRDMTVWEANEKAAQEQQENPYDDAYEGIREEIHYYLNDVILQNLPIEAYLDYVDFSEPGSFEAYAQESLPKSAIEMITEDEGYIDDMVYIDEPRDKHIRRMDRGLGSLVGFPLDKYKNMPPPENESDTTEEEIEYLEDIPVDKNLVDSADEIRQHFKNFLSPKGLEYPKEEMKEVMQGVKAIILILKYYYNRPRPWQIADAKGLELNSETLQSSSSPSYPSGHATQGRFIARYLSDLYPEYRDEITQIGEEIAYSRNMAKVHYPSDSAFGKLLGDEMYDFITTNIINESAPQPGSSSAEGFDDKDLPYETEYLTLDQILNRVENIAYYREVLRDLQDDKDDWEVTQTVKRYADYWMENPESLTGPDFPPIQVIGKGMKDGSHRISTLNALANYIDVDNPYWKDVKLEVRFYDPETVMASGHYYPWLWDISDEDLQQAIDDKVYNWEVLERWLADPNAKSDLQKLRAESLNEHKESKLNPQLMMGDEIMVVSTEGIHDFGAPELYKPYVVVGIKHGTTMNREIHNWTHGEDEEQRPDISQYPPELQARSRLGFRKEFDTIPYTYYQIEPIGMTDEERTGAMLAGGGRMKPMYIFPTPNEYRGSDQWILRPGFLRGEHLNEGRKNFESIPPIDEIQYGETMNLKPNVGDKIILIDKEEALQAFEANQPELFTPYVVISKHDYNFQIVKVDEYDYWKGWVERGSDEVPSPQKIFYPLDYKWMPADTPTDTNVDRLTISEQIETELNPELEIDDVIRIVDIDRERESGETMYTTPSPELRPEMLTPYSVVEKESAGHKSKWPFKYTIVPEGEIEITGRNPYGEENTNVKLLYPWIYQWIYAHKKTITEHNQPGLSPDLEVDDVIRVIEIDGEHARMPERWGIYKVKDVKQDNATQELYYDIVPYPEPELPDSDYMRDHTKTWGHPNQKTLYHGDIWIPADIPMATGVDRLTISEHKESNINPKLKVGDEIIVVEVEEIDGRGNDSKQPEKYVRYFVTKIYHGDEFHRYPWSQKYYGLNRPDVDVTDPERPGVYDRSSIHKYLFPDDTWMFNPKGPTMRYEDAFESDFLQEEMISEHKEELNQPLTMGDVIRVVDVDKDSTYEQPKYPYDTGNDSGNSLMTNHHRDQIHGQDTYPHPMRLYAVMSKSLYRTKDRDYLNPYWMLWPVDDDGKVESVKDFHEIILTDKDTWMTVKKHHSNIPGDIEAKHKEYVDSGRDIISRQLDEQVMMKGDMLKSDIITFLTNRFILGSTDYSELKDNKGNYYRIIDMKDPYEHVTLSDLIEPTIEFVSSGIKSGDFEEEDMNTALTAITNWVSLEMNQKKELVN